MEKEAAPKGRLFCYRGLNLLHPHLLEGNVDNDFHSTRELRANSVCNELQGSAIEFGTAGTAQDFLVGNISEPSHGKL